MFFLTYILSLLMGVVLVVPLTEVCGRPSGPSVCLYTGFVGQVRLHICYGCEGCGGKAFLRT